MKLKAAVAFILLWALDEATTNENGNLTIYEEPHGEHEQAVNVHSRKKRYIVFPKGSSLQILLEVLSHVPTGFRVFVGPTLQVAWELPSERLRTFRSRRSSLTDESGYHLKPFFKCNAGSRERRSAGKKFRIFSDLATLMDYGGSNGRQCVLKALCESGQRTPSKKDFLREILHKIFSVDSEEDLEETEEDAAYRKAHRSVNQNCDALYPDCKFSIFGAIQ